MIISSASINRIIYVLLIATTMVIYTKYFQPFNISKAILFTICLSVAVIITIIVLKQRESILKIYKNIVRVACITAIILVFFITALAIFSTRFITNTSNGEKVLLPLNCKNSLCKLYEKARERGEEIGDYLGRDGLINVINNCCKPELLKAEIIYDSIIVMLLNTIFFGILITSSYFLEGTGITNSRSEPAKLSLFLSYASEEVLIAEELCFALQNSQHSVFFDRTVIEAGADYNMTIARAIKSSDILIFLISPDSVKQGTYTLTELEIAKQTWAKAEGHILPVMAIPTDFSIIPNYLKSVSILQPAGSLAAEVTLAINSYASSKNPMIYPSGSAI